MTKFRLAWRGRLFNIWHMPAPLARILLLLTVLLLGAAPPGGAQAASRSYPALQPGAEGVSLDLVIYGTTDTALFTPVIDAFQQSRPAVSVVYHELQSEEIDDRLRAETAAGGPTADFVLSSAMDLQFKLANDGFAQAVDVPSADALPPWAVWRDTAFGLTFEPAVMVYHRPSFADRPPPQSRADLRRLLSEEPEALAGRIGTYDIERSGVGFLMLARDAEIDDGIWSLVSLMGRAGVKLYTDSAAVIDKTAQGRLAVGYNVLGSYAAAMAADRPDLGIVVPRDYTVVLSRVGLVPRAARSPEAGRLFLDFLASQAGQTVLADQVNLNALHPGVTGDNTMSALLTRSRTDIRPVRVGAGLLVYRDQSKRRRLLDRWREALVVQ